MERDKWTVKCLSSVEDLRIHSEKYPEYDPTFWSSLAFVASSKGQSDIIKWICDNRLERCGKLAMDNAAEHGFLNIVIILHNYGESCTTDAFDYAARNGHFEIVKFLHYNRPEGCTKKAIDWASKYGKFDIVVWLYKNRKEGYSNMAKEFAHESGCTEISNFLEEEDTRRELLKQWNLACR